MITKNISKIKGAYIILLRLDKEKYIQIGKLGKFYFKKGFYAYIGSALGTGGFRRVERHCNIAEGKNLTRRWHIDYLLPCTEIFCTMLIPTDKRIECKLAMAIGGIKDIQKIFGFGSTDCFCDSHLFYSENEIKNEIIDTGNKFGNPLMYKSKN